MPNPNHLLRRSFALLLLAVVALCLGISQNSQAQVKSARPFATVTDVSFTPLSNGVQVRVVADGLLQYRNQVLSGKQMRINFPDAKNGTGKNFFKIDSYPVSYIQLTTPQGAEGGIGLDMVIHNLISTSAALFQSADRTDVVFTIQSDRTLSTPGTADTQDTATPEAITENGVQTEVRYARGVLSVRAIKADIHALVATIARSAGISVAVDGGVQREVSLNLRNLPPLAALQAIATSNGLALSKNGELYVLAEGTATDLATYRLSSTESFRMQNTQAQTASGLLPNFLYSFVKVNPEQNAIVVTAPTQMLSKIGDDLQKMDVPAPQISIEAIAVELSDTNELDLGIRLGSPSADATGSINPVGGAISYNTIGRLPDDFEVSLRALELDGKARVRARPRMAVVNGRTANIFIGAQRFILTQFNQSGQTQTRIQPVDVGVKLNVTPLTGGNGEITIRMAPEVSNITDLDIQTGLPLLSTRRAETTVRVKDGETIAIGGLSLAQEQTKRGKIPFLGDIPLIGPLFRTRSRNNVRTELVIFVTPRILDTNGEAVPAGESTPITP